MGSDGSGASQVPADGWYAVLDGQQSGPMTLSVLVGAVEEGRAGPSTYVWRQGFDEWTRADEVAGLAELVATVGAASGGPTRVAPAPAESTVSDEDLDDLRKTVAVDMDQVMAAVKGPEGDATTATPVSEVPPDEGDASSSMDSLFSGETAPATSDQGFFDAADSQAVDQKVMLYQRRDTSVLFSLDEFGKSGPESGGAGGGDGFGERTPESGLIDIRSVARNRPDTGSSSALFEESKPAPSSTGDSFSTRINTQTEPLLRSRKKKGPPMWALVAGGLAVAMLGAGVAVFVVTGDKADVAEVATPQVALNTATAPPETLSEKAPAADKPKAEDPAPEVIPAAQPDASSEETVEAADAGAASPEPDAVVPAEEKVEEPTPEPKKAVAVAAAKPAKVKKPKKKKVVKATPKPAKAKKPEPKPAPAPKKKEAPVPAKPKSSDKADSATALLDSLGGGGGGGGSKSSAPAAASSAPKKLSKSAIRKVVRKYTSKVIGCYKKSSAASEGTGLVTVTARLNVAPSGSVQSVSVVGPFGGTPVGACISGKLKGAKFPAFGGSAQTVPMTFRVR